MSSYLNVSDLLSPCIITQPVNSDISQNDITVSDLSSSYSMTQLVTSSSSNITGINSSQYYFVSLPLVFIALTFITTILLSWKWCKRSGRMGGKIDLDKNKPVDEEPELHYASLQNLPVKDQRTPEENHSTTLYSSVSIHHEKEQDQNVTALHQEDLSREILPGSGAANDITSGSSIDDITSFTGL